MKNKATAFAKTLDMLNIVGLKESIQSLLKKESKYVPAATVCNTYMSKLDEGLHEEEICEDFVGDLSKVAVHESAKDILYTVSTKINEHKRDINLVKLLYSIQRGQHEYIIPMIESAAVEYMTNKNPETRSAVRQSLSLFEGIPEVNSILESLSFDEYEEKTNKVLVNSSLNESMIPHEEVKTYTQEELDKIVAEEKVKAVNESAAVLHKSMSDVDTHINLDATIKNILKNSTNESLKVFCEQYLTALNSGKAEETLYEGFISGLSKWNYLNAVDTEMSALTDRIEKYQQDIDLKKILKVMEGTSSYYIVPLIEGVVADYVLNKSMANKAILKQRLHAFEYDPFVRDILNVVTLDQSLHNTVYFDDSVEKLNNYVHTEKVFSPVQYVKENECIFNVKGTYYNRKGNTITKLSKKSIDNLNESFKMLCNLINHPAVKIDELSNTISIYEGADSAKISETSIILNGEEKTSDEIKKIAQMSHLMNENKEGFYKAIEMINENFDKIAYIDFVKRVSMNESNGKSADVFRVKNNIFVTVSDAVLGTSTFYRNANPIQCRNYINEHMGINVSSMFEDILPGQKAILEGIEDTKKSYENYLDELISQKEDFERMKEDAEDMEEIDAAINAIDDEIEEVKKKYDEFQKDSEKFVVGDDTDADTESPDDVASIDNDEDDVPTETPAEMEEPIENTLPQDDLYIDPDQAAIDAATPYDPDFDVISEEDDEKSEIKVLRVSYSENIKTGKKSNKGTAYIVIPSVDANGDIKDETRIVTFYLDANRKPVINNDYMPLMVYNSIVKAIAADPDTEYIDVDSADEPTDDDLPKTEVITNIEPDYTEEIETTVFPDGEETTVDTVEEEPMFGLESEDDDVNDTEVVTDITDVDGDEFVKVDKVERETPAEVEDKADDVTYPIELGLNIKDILPIKKESFIKACEDMCIECSIIEGEEDSVTLKFLNKAAVFALRDYFKEWKNFSPAQFVSFFPELEKCFQNRGPIQVSPATKPAKPLNLRRVIEPQPLQFNESKKDNFILDITAINESANVNSGIKMIIPMTESYAKLFNIPMKKNKKSIEIITESLAETKEVYEKINALNIALNGKLDKDAKMFLKNYKKKFGNVSESNVININVPYNNFLAQKLESKGIYTVRLNENLNIILESKDYKAAKQIFKSIYKDAAPVEVRDFFQLSEDSMNEGVKIRIEDTKTGKVVELDTDQDNSNTTSDKGKNEPELADPFKDSHTTFHIEDSALFGSDVDSSDEGKEKDQEKDEHTAETDSENNSDEQTDSSSNQENSSEKPETEEKKRKFKFRPKQKSNESIEIKNQNQSLNESERPGIKSPNVLDFVTIKTGQSGQIIAKMPNGNFIVNVAGHTIEADPKSVKMINELPDTVEVPYRFDPRTLKGLFEQYVHCGMFINENQITPNNTLVKYSDFINAGPEEDVTIVIDGQPTVANKKYIRVTDEINDFANVNDYVEGEEISADGSTLRQLLFNLKDYEVAQGNAEPVRTLVNDEENEKYILIYLPVSSIKPIKI